MSDVGGSADSAGATYTFDTTAAATLPDGSASPIGRLPADQRWDGRHIPSARARRSVLSPGPAGTDSLTAFNGINPNGTWSLYVVDDVGGDIGNFAGGWELTITTSAPAVTSDFNGTGRRIARCIGHRPATWFVQGQPAVQLGLPGDIPVAGDYNGDGTTDRAVYRPSTGTWFVHGQGASAVGARRRHPRARRLQRRRADGTRGVSPIDRHVVRAEPVASAVGAPRRHPRARRLQR